MGNKRARSGHSRKRAVAMAHAEQVSLARLEELEFSIATSPEFTQYRKLVSRFGDDIVAAAVTLACELPWQDADESDPAPQIPLPNAPNGDRCGPQGRAIVQEIAEVIQANRAARKESR